MSQWQTVDYQLDNHVAIISLNRPQARNAMNAQLRAELFQAITTANNDRQVRVVVITGNGKGFCAGADLAEDMPDADQDGFITQVLRTEYHPILLAITESSKPFIAAVNGAAAGIGGALAMACDLTVMAEDAFLYSAFGAISLLPDGGTHWMLARYLGNKKAFEMIAESQRLTAVQCEQLGLANRVVAADKLVPEAISWAQSLSAKAPLTMQYSKLLLREVATQSLAQSMDREAQLQTILFTSQDFKEGTRAFFAKRSPQFTGE